VYQAVDFCCEKEEEASGVCRETRANSKRKPINLRGGIAHRDVPEISFPLWTNGEVQQPEPPIRGPPEKRPLRTK